jgi:radical SAM-linked protein
MADDKKYPYMLNFKRLDFSRYIAHLDWIRIVQSALDRSDLPLSYTEGFAPKAKLKFSPPLPVGCASLGELVLIFLRENLSESAILLSMDDSMPDGMPLTNVHYMQITMKNPFQAINGALYEFSFPFEIQTEKRNEILAVCLGTPGSEIYDDELKNQSALIVKVINADEFIGGDDKIGFVARLEEGKTFHPVKFALALSRALSLVHVPQPLKKAFLNIDDKGARKLFQFD